MPDQPLPEIFGQAINDEEGHADVLLGSGDDDGDDEDNDDGPDEPERYAKRYTIIDDDAETYARHKPAAGQSGFAWDEEKHPRDDRGEFASKGADGRQVVEPDPEKEPPKVEHDGRPVAVPPKNLAAALAEHGAGGALRVATSMRVTHIDQKVLDKWKAAGQELLKEEGNGYRMRTGKNSVYLIPGLLQAMGQTPHAQKFAEHAAAHAIGPAEDAPKTAAEFRRIRADELREEHAELLATPLASEGSISPAQIGMMSDRQRKKWQENAQKRMQIEAQIRDLEKDDETLDREKTAKRQKEIGGRLAQINSVSEILTRTGIGKSGKIRPSIQKDLDNLAAEKSDLEAELSRYAKRPNADVPPAVKREHIDNDVDQYARSDGVELRRLVEEAANATEREPSEAQKAAGNYPKGRVTVQGLPITIETPRGAIRSGKDADGHAWHQEMPSHYGYIRRTESEADGDHIDVFLGPKLDSRIVYVIDRHHPHTGEFDEHKCMVGWKSEAEAVAAYKAAYDEAHHGFKNVTPVSMFEFAEFLNNGDTARPIAEQMRE